MHLVDTDMVYHQLAQLMLVEESYLSYRTINSVNQSDIFKYRRQDKGRLGAKVVQIRLIE